MSFFKKLFSKDEPFVPTPTQQIPGLEPIVVQAIENLFPNAEDQKQAFQYSLKWIDRHGGKKDSVRLLLALLSTSKGKTGSFDLDPGIMNDGYYIAGSISNIFPKMKAAEEWVKSITKPRF